MVRALIPNKSKFTNGVVAEGDRNFLLSYPTPNEALSPGNYQLSGELVWGEDKDKTKLPFKVDVVIPTLGNKQ